MLIFHSLFSLFFLQPLGRDMLIDFIASIFLQQQNVIRIEAITYFHAGTSFRHTRYGQANSIFRGSSKKALDDGAWDMPFKHIAIICDSGMAGLIRWRYTFIRFYLVQICRVIYFRFKAEFFDM